MSSSPPSPAEQFDALLTTVVAKLQTYKSNFVSQTSSSLARLTPTDIIRLVIIVGAYCLLRPYLIKLGGRFQARDHERELDSAELERVRNAEGKGKNSDDGLGKVEIASDTDSEDEGEGTGADWGKKARRRQRRVLRGLIDAEQKRRQEEEEAASDKEIEEFLTG